MSRVPRGALKLGITRSLGRQPRARIPIRTRRGRQLLACHAIRYALRRAEIRWSASWASSPRSIWTQWTRPLNAVLPRQGRRFTGVPPCCRHRYVSSPENHRHGGGTVPRQLIPVDEERVRTALGEPSAVIGELNAKPGVGRRNRARRRRS
jgi:hypothetical protein